VDETNLVLRKGLAHAVSLQPAPDRELLLLVAQEMFRRPAARCQRRPKTDPLSTAEN